MSSASVAQSGVLPFIRGVDLSFVDHGNLPSSALGAMKSLKWLKMTSANWSDLRCVVDNIDAGARDGVESLDLRHNVISNGLSAVDALPVLTCLNLSHNKLSDEAVLELHKHAKTNHAAATEEVPLFSECSSMTTLDLSYNKISLLPAAPLTSSNLLSILNVSHNELSAVPQQVFIAHQSTLRHVNVSHNHLSMLPPQLRRLTKLTFLDISHNPMEHYQMRPLPFLTSLQTLSLSSTNIDLSSMQASELQNLTVLRNLDLSLNDLTQIPDCVFGLPSLVSLNLSSNSLTVLPEDFGSYWSKTLTTLNLCRNQLQSLPPSICKLGRLAKLLLNENDLSFHGLPAGLGKLGQLVVFSAADNKIEMIPESLCRCPSLKRLILSRNRLISLPVSIYLTELDVMDLRGNEDLKMPEKPASESLQSGQSADVSRDVVSNLAADQSSLVYYNIDFDLEHQLKLAGSKEMAARVAAARKTMETSNNAGRSMKDVIARKMRLRRLRHQTSSFSAADSADPGSAEAAAAVVLKGMRDIAHCKSEDRPDKHSASAVTTITQPYERPPIDYSSFFDPDVGRLPGITFWVIDNFYPTQMEDENVTQLYEGDCYIILDTRFVTDSEATGPNLQWLIYYWIGSKATLDKLACSAMHAVNLRNHLDATSRTSRQEQGDEDEEFLALFPNCQPIYAEGARTACGFYSTDDAADFETRIYAVVSRAQLLDANSTAAIASHGHEVEIIPVKPVVKSLQSGHVYIIDGGRKIVTWVGKGSAGVLTSKACFLAEKINKEERKNQSEVIVVREESEECATLFNELLSGKEEDDTCDEEADNFKPVSGKCLYRVEMGVGYLELHQVSWSTKRKKLFDTASKKTQSVACSSYLDFWRSKQDLRMQSIVSQASPRSRGIDSRLQLSRHSLHAEDVYILDTPGSDLFVWMGSESSRLLRVAASRLATDLFASRPWGGHERPNYAVVTKVTSGIEPIIFKTKFADWTDVVAVDFSRTAESVRKTGADLVAWASKQDTKADLSALFRQPMAVRDPTYYERVNEYLAMNHANLEKMEAYVLDGRHFVRLSAEEVGIFYSGASYVYLCRYVVTDADRTDSMIGLSIGDERLGSSTSTTKIVESSRAQTPGAGSLDRQTNGSLPSDDGESDVEGDDVDDDITPNDFQCVVYFWQGRDCSNMGWLTFTFGLQKKFEALFGDKLCIVRMHQQQETVKFLSHFISDGIVVKLGHRPRCDDANNKGSPVDDGEQDHHLFQLRCVASSVRRCIQLSPSWTSGQAWKVLNSDDVFVLRTNASTSYHIWCGSRSTHADCDAAHKMVVAKKLAAHATGDIDVTVVDESADSVFNQIVDPECQRSVRDDIPVVNGDDGSNFQLPTRLFRCSNSTGFFRITECCVDFCQDDLASDDIMILDCGHTVESEEHLVYVWIGDRCSEIEAKLGYKSAQVYLEHLQLQDPTRHKRLLVTFKGKEAWQFKACFAGWNHFKQFEF